MKFDSDIIKNGGEYLSCVYLNHALRFEPNVIFSCCMPSLSRKSPWIFPILIEFNEHTIFDYDSILKTIIDAKIQLIENLNNNEDCVCTNCNYLVFKKWQPLHQECFALTYILFAHDHACNANCMYCYQNHKSKSKYSMLDFIQYLIDKKFIKTYNIEQIVWEGGEPTIGQDFNELFNLLWTHPKNLQNYIPTTAINYSKEIVELLSAGPNYKGIICISLDSGTRETYQKIKKVDQFDNVITNVKKYYDCASDKSNIILKYIMLNENSDTAEIDSFMNLIKTYELSDCTFYLASDIFSSELSLKIQFGIFYFYNQLKKQFNTIPDLWGGIIPNYHEIIRGNFIVNDFIVTAWSLDYKGANIGTFDNRINTIEKIVEVEKIVENTIYIEKKLPRDVKIIKKIINKVAPHNSPMREFTKSIYYLFKAIYRLTNIGKK